MSFNGVLFYPFGYDSNKQYLIIGNIYQKQTKALHTYINGLIGHSFGGYEAIFIITQTNLFAAAVAGSGISDLTNGYLSVNWGYKNMNSWRYEYQQFRMKKTLFDDYEGYRRNSPIYFASNVNTPLFHIEVPQ